MDIYKNYYKANFFSIKYKKSKIKWKKDFAALVSFHV